MNIPGFEIGRVLGEGGMATVYLAQQLSLGRQVALKVMSPALIAADGGFCERFINEGKIIAKLRHQHIVTIYDIGCANDRDYFMAMEYCPGGTLKQYILDGRSRSQALTILRQIAAALGYAHDHGFIHRDIKPGNVLFRDDGTAVLSDFGIAKTVDGSTRVTREGWAIGTPEYMSPEQAAGKDLSPSSDLYSLGVVLYETLTGQKPFRGPDALSTAMQHANAPIPHLPSEFVWLQHVLDGLLAKNPLERFASADELIAEIDAVERARPQPRDEDATRILDPGALSAARESGPHERRVARRRTANLGLTALIVVIVAVGAWFALEGLPFFSADTGVERVASPTDALVRPEPPPALPPQVAARIARLLDVAQMHMAVGRQCEPPGSSAYEAYALVVEMDPQNAEARAALQRLEATCGAD
ncbi:MAG: serine/threonine-protein kinase [Chromatiaceae bacterium]